MTEKKVEKFKEKKTEQYTPKEIKDAEIKVVELIECNQAEVYKEYLSAISTQYAVLPPSTSLTTVSYFNITKFVIEEKDIVIDKLKNVYHMLANSDSSLALIITRKKDGCEITLAVGQSNPESSTKQAQRIKDALLGNFPGTQSTEIQQNNNRTKSAFEIFDGGVVDDISSQNYFSAAVISNIATEFSEDFANQGIEKLIDGIKPKDPHGKDAYTLVLLGKALSIKSLQEKKDFICELYQSFSPFAKKNMTWGVNEAKNWSSNWSVGANGGIRVGKKKLGAQVGLNGGFGHSWGGSVAAHGDESVEVTNYNIQHTLEILEKQMQRLDTCSALGMWDFSGYVFSRDFEVTEKVARMYLSLTQGNESFYEQPSTNTWNGTRSDANGNRAIIREIMRSVGRLEHPKFRKKDSAPKYWPCEVNATTTISGSEIAYALNLPRKSVPGCAVIQCAAFGREISSYDSFDDNDIKYNIGLVHHMHETDANKLVTLDANSLASHTFITGSTGSGKSNTVYQLLSEAKKNKVKFLVIEPAKGEYKYAFSDDVTVYGTNPALGEVLKINPFAFPKEIHIFEHIDRLLDVFNVCWPMYAAMPAVLKKAIINAYEDKGWDLECSRGNSYPTFRDVLNQIDVVMNSSDYSDENKSNYKGALKTRIESLCTGLNGIVFCDENTTDVSMSALFENNVIVDLSRIGANDTKALIMGIFVIKLQEYRMSRGGINQPLNHLTVLEEAHNLLKRTTDNGPEGNNVAAKSVEMFANAIAEMRTYGEGFVIVDQSPGLMDMSVIRNTNTKIIMRLPDISDRELVGKAAGLNEDQINELSRLQRGVAAIYQNEWIEAVLCKVPRYTRTTTPCVTSEDEQQNYRNIIADTIYNPNRLLNNERTYIKAVDSLELSEDIKNALLEYYYNRTTAAQAVAAKLFFGIKDETFESIRKKIEHGEDILVDTIIMDELARKSEVAHIQIQQIHDLRLRDEFCQSIRAHYHLLGNEDGSVI